MSQNYPNTKTINYLLSELKKIGGNSEGGISRLGYTALETEAHQFVVKYLKNFGVPSVQDQAGNTLIGDYLNPIFLIGSHLDTVPNGGAFDGSIGIVAGAYVLCSLKEQKQHDGVCLALFRCEEASRFGKAHIGSIAYSSGSSASLLQATDGKETIAQLTNSLNIHSNSLAIPNPYLKKIKAFFEIHIEQAEFLSEHNKVLGIVDGIAGFYRYKFSLLGKFDHSGTTPMHKRKDALCAVSEITLLLENLCKTTYKKKKAYAVGTISKVDTPQGSLSQVCGFVEALVDIRSANPFIIEKCFQDFVEKSKKICSRRGIELVIQQIDRKQPALMDKDLIQVLQQTSKSKGMDNETTIMPSMAGHDAMEFAQKGIPTAMVFVQSSGGSHNPLEFAQTDHIQTGADLLLSSIMSLKAS